MAIREMFQRLPVRAVVSGLLVLAVFVAGSSRLNAWLAGSPLGWADVQADRYVARTLSSAVAMYGAARVINASVSVIQDSEVQATLFGTGASIAIGEALDPVNDLVEQFSVVMLYSCSALGVAKVLAKVGPWLGFQVLLPLALVLVAVGLWVPAPAGRSLAAFGGRLALVALVVRMAVPAACYLDDRVYALFLGERYEEAAGVIGEQAREEETDAGGVMERLKATVIGGTGDFAARIKRLAGWASDMLVTITDVIVVFLVQTLLLPLLFLYLLAKIVRLLLGASRERRLERAVRSALAQVQAATGPARSDAGTPAGRAR